MARLHRPQPISGFPEYLPALRRVEQRWLDIIRATFESWGFTNIETPSVEDLAVLTAKGETADKEIYTLTRLQAAEDEAREARLGLHYDLTVPFARYAAMHFSDLKFPFKRYQMQRVWRGERPQDGRFREFTQCDVDVIGVDSLALHFDAELPAVVLDALERLKVPPVTLSVSNRKILSGFLAGMGIQDSVAMVRAIDRLDKIGPSGVGAELTALGLAPDQVQRSLDLAAIRTADDSFAARAAALGVEHVLLEQGLEDLAFVIRALNRLAPGRVMADLSIARGFDYYSGTVYEGRLEGSPGYGAITGGGRYENLAGGFINRTLPGVGISIGFTRLFARMAAEGRFAAETRISPADLLVVLGSEADREAVMDLAARFRRRGVRVEQYHLPHKIGRQIGYAAERGIPYVWLPPLGEGEPHQVKDLATGQQQEADPEIWVPVVG